MQIPLMNGVYVDNQGNFRTGYPANLLPVPRDTGISSFRLDPTPGIKEFGTGPGVDRGGINWNNKYYRVMGTKLCYIDEFGAITQIGDVGGSDRVTLDYSFDYLGINSNKNLYLYDGSTLTQITDSDLGDVLDFVWIDGYFTCTDGEFIVVTELNNPFSVLSLKYGSSEIDPDPIIGLEELRNELVAINRYTTEFFDNIGGDGFPFERIEGAQIMRGAVGKDAFCIYDEKLAFVGSGRKEPNAVWIAYSGTSVKISTREIDIILKEYTESQLSSVIVESQYDINNQFLWIKLPNKTLIYDLNASKAAGIHIWHVRHSGTTMIDERIVMSEYRAQNAVWVYDNWHVGDPTTNKYGYLVNDVSSHFGEHVYWEFGTQILYNETKGAILYDVELTALTGYVENGDDPVIYTQYSLDGQTRSMLKRKKTGKIGERAKRICWIGSNGNMRDRRSQYFIGLTDSNLTISRLDARIEPLYV